MKALTLTRHTKGFEVTSVLHIIVLDPQKMVLKVTTLYIAAQELCVDLSLSRDESDTALPQCTTLITFFAPAEGF